MNAREFGCQADATGSIRTLKDHHIIVRIQRLFGQPGATEQIQLLFAEFYNRHIIAVMGLIRERLGKSKIPDCNAEDIAQEAFQGLWRQIIAGRQIANPSAYLRQIVCNCISDAYERRYHHHQLNPHLSRREIQQRLQTEDDSLRQIHEVPFETHINTYDGESNLLVAHERPEASLEKYQSKSDIETNVVRNEFREICLQVINTLPHEHWKTVTRLHKLEGWTYSEIAAEMNLSVEQVKGYGKRAAKVFMEEMRKRFQVKEMNR